MTVPLTEEKFELIQTTLEKRGVIDLKIVSPSMSPVVVTGELVSVIHSDGGFKRFDIVVFRSRSKLICHYVWYKNKIKNSEDQAVLITRSIAGAIEDLPVPLDDIVGKVVSHKIPARLKFKIIARALIKRLFKG